VVERTFARLCRHRRLAKEFETLTANAKETAQISQFPTRTAQDGLTRGLAVKLSGKRHQNISAAHI
jgi:hypothetical protein